MTARTDSDFKFSVVTRLAEALLVQSILEYL